jgi:ketosteroid isomerase-like protein
MRVPQDSLGTMQRLYAALAKRDIPGAVALLAPDVVFETPEGQAFVGGRHSGRDAAVSGVWGRLAQDWEPITAEVAEMVPLTDGRVLVTGRYRGILKSNGNRLDTDFAHLWTVREGQAVHLKVFTDTAVWNEAWTRRP